MTNVGSITSVQEKAATIEQPYGETASISFPLTWYQCAKPWDQSQILLVGHFEIFTITKWRAGAPWNRYDYYSVTDYTKKPSVRLSETPLAKAVRKIMKDDPELYTSEPKLKEMLEWLARGWFKTLFKELDID